MIMVSKLDTVMYEAQRQGRITFYLQNYGEWVTRFALCKFISFDFGVELATRLDAEQPLSWAARMLSTHKISYSVSIAANTRVSCSGALMSRFECSAIQRGGRDTLAGLQRPGCLSSDIRQRVRIMQRTANANRKNTTKMHVLNETKDHRGANECD